MAEKPEWILTAALDNHTDKMRIAVVKNRSGKQDPTASDPAVLQAVPGITSFASLES